MDLAHNILQKLQFVDGQYDELHHFVEILEHIWLVVWNIFYFSIHWELVTPTK